MIHSAIIISYMPFYVGRMVYWLFGTEFSDFFLLFLIDRWRCGLAAIRPTMLNSFNELQGKQSAALKSFESPWNCLWKCAGLGRAGPPLWGPMSPEIPRQMSVAIKQWSLGNEKLPVYPAQTLVYLIKKLTDSNLLYAQRACLLLFLSHSLSLSLCSSRALLRVRCWLGNALDTRRCCHSRAGGGRYTICRNDCVLKFMSAHDEL